ncbi:DNA-binding transcriptional regulator DsdC [Enterovibrio norvegicus]|uniref:DNA-binding transcriptional regulator DsdC n=1 Tax=Enterovibrio norvegicus TaxID=188144 RepID=A0ABV4KZC4_9GAMM|nr:DNA-binding transcriptional regulator DsdC [Enterovibrio norvegicus]OEF58376.1 DNA-binding transcriptional regulator DsdC [Enterovibrio norvegicus]OEF64453.1 DNA-binding transcriptional regulator DsdC [Enterovibrio norvegicus]
MKLPQLSSSLLAGLHCFSIVAETMSFTRAAEQLHLTQSAVSHRIKKLEQRLDVALFVRRPRHLSLTNEGEQLRLVVTEQFSAISLKLLELNHAKPVGDFIISAPPTFAQRWLVPRLHQFAEAFPDVTLHLRTRNDLVDFKAEAFDCAIYFGHGRYTGLCSHHLLDDAILPVCSPSYAERHDLYGNPHKLAECQLLHDAAPWASASLSDEWLYWANANGVELNGTNHSFDRADLALEAASSGMGVAIGRMAYIQEHLHSGRLVAPIDLSVKSPYSFYLVYREEQQGNAKIMAFKQWLFEQLPANGEF